MFDQIGQVEDDFKATHSTVNGDEANLIQAKIRKSNVPLISTNNVARNAPLENISEENSRP